MKWFLDQRVLATVGDITTERVDAIVNAANSTLLGGGGVDGAIHAKGGQLITEECRQIRQSDYPAGLPTGHAVITSGGLLPAKYVIHTVGPIYGENGNRDGELLSDCYKNSMKLAAQHSLTTIAFPSISTGVYGYPKHKAAEVASRTILECIDKAYLKEVRLIFYSSNDLEIFLTNHQF